MSRPWCEQVVLVTGGASGIGLATASRMQSLGAQVALLDLNPDGLKAAKEKLDGKPLTVECDVSNETSVNQAVRQVADRFGRIDAFLNSAGIAGKTNLKTHEVETD
ncbi:MAG: SDR family NAD(P)-dependent oxidoreductase, partial [Verrucomicrobiae bacterium]|nr:SDR family NAD(P)-dependent oxidoreductase [Verrucomicrobiae bacterium]